MFDNPTARHVSLHFQGSSQPDVCIVGGEMLGGASSASSVEITCTSVILPMGVSGVTALCVMSHDGCDLLCEIPANRWDVEQAARDGGLVPAEVASRVRHGASVRQQAWSTAAAAA